MATLENEELYVFEVDRSRINQQCYFMNAEKENNWRHQYILNILNEKNEVIPLFHPTNQDKYYCNVQFEKVEKVLKKALLVRICARGKIQKMDDGPGNEVYDFGDLGKHKSPYFALTFDTICSDKECFSISDTWTYTCPGFKRK